MISRSTYSPTSRSKDRQHVMPCPRRNTSRAWAFCPDRRRATAAETRKPRVPWSPRGWIVRAGLDMLNDSKVTASLSPWGKRKPRPTRRAANAGRGHFLRQLRHHRSMALVMASMSSMRGRGSLLIVPHDRPCSEKWGESGERVGRELPGNKKRGQPYGLTP